MLKYYISDNYISYKFMSEEIGKSPQAYGIKDESLIKLLPMFIDKNQPKLS